MNCGLRRKADGGRRTSRGVQLGKGTKGIEPPIQARH